MSSTSTTYFPPPPPKKRKQIKKKKSDVYIVEGDSTCVDCWCSRCADQVRICSELQSQMIELLARFELLNGRLVRLEGGGNQRITSTLSSPHRRPPTATTTTNNNNTKNQKKMSGVDVVADKKNIVQQPDVVEEEEEEQGHFLDNVIKIETRNDYNNYYNYQQQHEEKEEEDDDDEGLFLSNALQLNVHEYQERQVSGDGFNLQQAQHDDEGSSLLSSSLFIPDLTLLHCKQVSKVGRIPSARMKKGSSSTIEKVKPTRKYKTKKTKEADGDDGDDQGNKKKRKKKKLTELTKGTRPKKPATAFSLFLKDYFRENSCAAAGLTARESFAAASAQWRLVPPDTKAKYEAQCAPDKAAYEVAMKKWRSEKDEWKRPTSPYGLYLKDYWERVKAAADAEGGGVTDSCIIVGQRCKAAWDLESTEVKDHYKQLFTAARSKYNRVISKKNKKIPTSL